MIKNDFNIDFKEFLDRYVINPPYDYTITFTYKNGLFQFDWLNAQKNKDGSQAYDFLQYDKNTNDVIKEEHYSSLKEAVDKALIFGVSFSKVYESEDSEIIDIS